MQVKQREIKFRAWIGEHKKIYDVNHIVFNAGEVRGIRATWIKSETNKKYIYNFSMKQFVLMQFTGLHDKNGKEIYEGDILEWDAKDDNGKKVITDVRFEKGAFVDDDVENEPIGSWNIEKEVLGNVWENPELLGKGGDK